LTDWLIYNIFNINIYNIIAGERGLCAIDPAGTIGDESDPPYSRSSLSKGLLKGTPPKAQPSPDQHQGKKVLDIKQPVPWD